VFDDPAAALNTMTHPPLQALDQRVHRIGGPLQRGELFAWEVGEVHLQAFPIAAPHILQSLAAGRGERDQDDAAVFQRPLANDEPGPLQALDHQRHRRLGQAIELRQSSDPLRAGLKSRQQARFAARHLHVQADEDEAG
jgi:hypothetical protein